MVASKRVGLLVTCLVDLVRPSVAFAAVDLLERAGCTVEVPAQTCCGQPAFNSGDHATARKIAEQVITAFEPYDYVVAPSGSCTGQVRVHYPELFAGDPNWQPRADALAAKTFELTEFLVDVLGFTCVTARCPATATYHDSCSSLRELNVRAAPRTLLQKVEGLTLVELADADVCCGFGGTFAVKYPDISNRMVGNKAGNVVATDADMLLSNDLGCLMNIAGKLSRDGAEIEVRHIAEVLAGRLDTPAIGVPARPVAADARREDSGIKTAETQP